jgi:hypothetical protein
MLTSEQARKIGIIGAKLTGEISKQRRLVAIANYDKDPKLCLICGKPLSYQQKLNRNKYCSHSCAATKSNQNRKVKRMCLFCGKILNKDQKKFCSHTCHGNYVTSKHMMDGEPCSPKSLRRYLLVTRVYMCSECGLPTWKNKPIPLEVHHIDGNCDNNKEENLELWCRNCHGLTENFGNRNKTGNGRRVKTRLKKHN